MKNKNQKMQVLKEDLIKYSKQIGILDSEIPQVAFGKKDLMILRPKKRYPTKRSNLLGCCYAELRLLFVNLESPQLKNMRDIRKVLLHELLHYRFEHLSHKEMDKRMTFIKQGKAYPEKHIERPKVTK